MAEDKALQMERGSLMGSSYFMVQLPDGTYEKRLKVPVNVDPGVHSSFNLDEVKPATNLMAIFDLKHENLWIYSWLSQDVHRLPVNCSTLQVLLCQQLAKLAPRKPSWNVPAEALQKLEYATP